MSKKISELATADSLDGSELVEVVQSGTNKQTTTQDIAGLGIRSATVTLHNDDIINLPTEGIEIIPAPGSDKVIQFIMASCRANIVTGYTVADGQYIYLEQNEAQVSNFLLRDNSESIGALTAVFSTGDRIFVFVPYTEASPVTGNDSGNVIGARPNTSQLNDAALEISANGSNFTGGHADNSLKVTVYYVVIDL